MNKQLFYQVGFYSLIALNIGFLAGVLCPISKTNVVEKPITVQHDTIYIDSIDNNKDSSKVTSYTLPYHPNDSVLMLELKRQNIKHPNIVLAQAKLETGHYTSNVCKKNNNLFGLMRGDKYHHFSHWKNSIEFYKKHIQSRYDGGNYYDFLNHIGYAEDKEYIKKLRQLV